ncbi:MAG: SDR family oxidoreductase [Candidatus Marinimicrobia bacterium]|jgi:dTDP-4-dehydrorhamnose reductase|nr:SDR family oxidoreductase [Candidatus Neomarinimicrobiota bacterium]MBT3501459.1 SDR family oxidoreductase [Candidatus Neomarinimicrobiota bacterium]MBT3839402.1 SDR family oxidoreductase [Candidatus Neomarinimicrobiota bacterium]MBT3998883.1 SDR family oxidoreductase [Candidatus Neomarinimicrobiota bacterium]MBT4283085.1 SDR family oxidoreductase [Candidatus Neomarinimicrobiota bacterium]
MRILITGAFGQLGSAVSKAMMDSHDVIRTGRFIPKGEYGITLDIQNKILLQNVVDVIQPDIIINLAAMTSVDGCELNPDLAKEINIAGVQHICESFDGKIIHFSTDYVFDGENGPYTESDLVNPISVYGETKLSSERILLYHNPNHLVIRGNVIYDDSPTTKASFLNWVVKSLEKNEEITVVTDQINNPTWTESMADITSLCIEKNLSGIVHWGDSNQLTRFDFAVKIAEKYELDKKLIKPITTEKLTQLAQRPLKSGLKSDKLIDTLGVIQPSIDDCLNAILKRNKI